MITLNGAWQMRRAGDAVWQEARVPGTVYTDLLRNGEMKDPFVGENEEEIKELSEYDYEYRRVFHVEPDEIRQKAVLTAEGLDTIADIYVNGKAVGYTSNMHRTYCFDITAFLTQGENVIEIYFHSPMKYVREAQLRNPLWGVSSTVPGYQQIRKAHSMFGWDWGPQLPDLGIFRNIYIENWSDGKIEDVYVRQIHSDGKVRMDFHMENVFTGSSEELTVSVQIQDKEGNAVFYREEPAQEKQVISAWIENPELWWPAGYGEQPLYQVTYEMKKSGEVIAKRQERIGLRTVTMNREKDCYGEKFGFLINGVTIFAKGGNFIPEDNLLGRTNREKTRKLLSDCVRANFNCIRVWGGGCYPEEYFYDICDELGLLVWQDFMFACAVYDLDEEFETNIREEFKDNIKRFRNHASLGMWCGNNEMEMAWLYWGIPQNEKLRQDYTTMFERILPEMVKKFSPDTFYWPASPSSGGGFVEPNGEHAGDAHYWDVWHGKKPFEDFESLNFRFASEYGFQSVPSIKTIRSFAREEDMNMFSNVMESHQKCIDNGHGNVTLMQYLFQYYLCPKDFKSTIYATQVLQADCLETAISHFRSIRGRCLGSTYWQVNDCNPVISWATIDYFGRWKAAHYVVKRKYAPVIITAKTSNGMMKFTAVNEQRESVNGMFCMRLCHQKKGVIAEESKPVKLEPLCAKEVSCLHLPEMHESEKRECYLVFYLVIDGKKVDETVKLLVKPKQFSFRKPDISVQIEETESAYALRLSTNCYARQVGIEFSGIDTVLEDNYFDLLPKEERVVQIQKKDLPYEVTKEQLEQEMELYSNYHIANGD